MNGWSPLFDALLVALVMAAGAFGWMVRAEKADRDCDRAYKRGYADAVRRQAK